MLVESSAQAVWETDPQGSVVEDSPSWREFTGQTREQWLGDGWFDAVHPDDREEAGRRWRDSISTGRPLDQEVRIRRADGSWCWRRVRAAPVRDEDGRVTRWVGMTSDVSRRKEAEEERELLLGELNHRVKNIFAVIRSLASQGDSHPEVERHKAALLARLDALVAAHTLALESSWSSIELAELVGRTLKAYMAERSDAVEIGGEPVRLEARRALSVALALHELATNAAKYGALSVHEGQVRVVWRIVHADGEQHIVLAWEEHGGPPVQPPTESGFGTRLIERVFAYELHGDAAVEFRSEGLRVEASFRLS